jgi:hypothetical protein
MSFAKIFAALSIAVVFAVFLPSRTHAVYYQSDKQCPPGGKVAQPCKDVTNGYTTSGHCTFIGVCKADNFPPSPEVPPEKHSSPVGPASSVGTSSPSVSTVSSSSAGVAVPVFGSDPSQWSREEVVAAAYQRAQAIPTVDSNGDIIESFIKFLNFQGATYLVTPSEILKVGADLQAAPAYSSAGGVAIPAEFNTEAFKSFAGLYPDLNSIGEAHSVDERIFAEKNINYGRSTFGEPSGVVGGGGNAFSAILSGIKGKIGSLSDEEQKTYSVLLIGAFLVAIYMVHDRYFSKGTRHAMEPSKTDYSKMARTLSDKNESVSKPIITAAQEPVIWDTGKKE